MEKKTLRSMTAYGRATFEHSAGRFTAEVQSVNRRYLECVAVLPRELQRFDGDVKKWISKVIFRGQVMVKVTAEFVETMPINAKPNLLMARQIKSAWEEIARELHIPPEKGFTLEMLANTEGLIVYESNLQDEETFRNILHRVINMALENLIEMKSFEGAVIQKEILRRIEVLKETVENIKKIPDVTKKYRQKLVERLNEILTGNIESEERIMREVGIYAERVDVAEELLRLESHLHQFSMIAEAPVESVGKKFDFLLQEMNREVNTIGSKSAELEISKLVIQAKSEIEKIREQIQNIE